MTSASLVGNGFGPRWSAGNRALWWLAVLFGGSLFWWAPHPPMSDLPQHAGQVRLWRDMLAGVSPWAPNLRLNLFTPYLIGYGLALPLAFILPVTVAVKVVLTAAYFAFVAMCIRLGRRWQVDQRLDWLYLPGFFGFACGWGFYTFLVSTPIGLAFVWLADRYGLQATRRNGVALTLLGLVLLASHGLMFLCGYGLGLGIVAVLTPWRLWHRRALPFLVMALAFAAYALASRQRELGVVYAAEELVHWGWNWRRVHLGFAYGLIQDPDNRPFYWVALALLPLPWLMGCRLQWARRVPNVVFVGVLTVLVFAPEFALRTGFLDKRFAVFVFPALAWLFAARASPVPPRWSGVTGLASLLLPVLVCFVLGRHALEYRRFAEETAGIDAAMARLAPGQRVISLTFDRASAAAANWSAYNHYAAWYQAEQGGFTEFNFAWYPPQVVRFRPGHLSAVKPGFDWAPESFDWRRDDADHAGYFFVRSDVATPAGLFTGAPCAPAVAWQGGEWTVFRRRPTCG